VRPATAPAASPLPQPDRPNGRPTAAIADHEAPLIRRAQAGDRDAFGELCCRHEDRVRRFVGSRLRHREADVDDLAVETFLAAMQSIGSFLPEQPGAFGNWLIGIARITLLRWHRGIRREAAIAERCAAAAADAGPVSPEEVALDRLEVADAMARLTSRTRRALVLQHVAGMSCAEVALALGTTKRSILALNRRVRTELRGEAIRCACGCGTALRPERCGRDRYAFLACARRVEATIAPVAVAAPVLCACGCGAALPAVRAHNRRYATLTCRNRAAWRRRKEAQRRYLAGPVTADPAVERVRAVVRATASVGITRAELASRTRLLAARLDRALDLLTARWAVAVHLEPSDGRLVMCYRALADAVEGRAA